MFKSQERVRALRFSLAFVVLNSLLRAAVCFVHTLSPRPGSVYWRIRFHNSTALFLSDYLPQFAAEGRGRARFFSKSIFSNRALADSLACASFLSFAYFTHVPFPEDFNACGKFCCAKAPSCCVYRSANTADSLFQTANASLICVFMRRELLRVGQLFHKRQANNRPR